MKIYTRCFTIKHVKNLYTTGELASLREKFLKEIKSYNIYMKNKDKNYDGNSLVYESFDLWFATKLPLCTENFTGFILD